MFSPYPADNDSQLGVILDYGSDRLLSEQSNGMETRATLRYVFIITTGSERLKNQTLDYKQYPYQPFSLA